MMKCKHCGGYVVKLIHNGKPAETATRIVTWCPEDKTVKNYLKRVPDKTPEGSESDLP